VVERNVLDLFVHQREGETEALVHAPQDQRRGSVGAIDDYFESAQAFEIERGREFVEICVERRRVRAQPADPVPLGERELAQVEDVEQLAGFGGGKIGPLTAQEFQRIPFGGVVAGADGDAAGRVQPPDSVLHHGSGNDAEVDHVVAAGEQSSHHAFADHAPASTRIAPDDHGAGGFEKSPEGRREIHDVAGGESGADDASDADGGDAQGLRGAGQQVSRVDGANTAVVPSNPSLRSACNHPAALVTEPCSFEREASPLAALWTSLLTAPKCSLTNAIVSSGFLSTT